MAGVPAPLPKMNQAGLDALKQSLQGVSFSNVAPPPQNPAAQYKAAANAYTASHWYNGGTTATPSTQAQNLANVVNQTGNPVAQNPTPYIQGVLGQAAKDTAAQTPKPQGMFNTLGTAGDGSTVPAGSVPAPSTGPSVPKFDAAGIAASRVAAQRAALAASVNAFDTSRTAAYKYAQGTTQGNRALLQFDNSNRGDQFGGSAREDLFRLQRQQGIEDTAANQAYQNDIAASDAKLAAFDAGAPGLQQDIQQQLEHQQLQDNLAQAGVTGQFNGSPTLAAQGQQFNQGIATAGLTGQYNGSPTLAASQQGFQNRLAYGNATGTFDNGQHTLSAITSMAQLTGKMPDGTPTNAAQQQQLQNQWTLADQTGIIPNSLADFYGLPHGMQTQAAKNQAAQIGISQQGASNSAANTKVAQDRLAWEKDPTNPANIYRGAQTDKANAQADNMDNKVPSKNSLDSTYVNNLNTMTPDKRDLFFKNEKANIIKDLGISGYNQLYSMYYDQYGAPKQ